MEMWHVKVWVLSKGPSPTDPGLEIHTIVFCACVKHSYQNAVIKNSLDSRDYSIVMSAQVSQRPPIEPGPPRWRRVLRRVLTTGIKIVCFVEAVHFLSDRSAKHQLRRHGWEDTSNFTEDEENTEEEAKDQVMDLLIDYVNGT